MRILWRITKLAALERGRMTVAWLSLIIATILFLAVPRLIEVSIDTALGDSAGTTATRDLVILALVIVAVIAVRGIFNYMNLYLSEAVSQRVSYRIRNLLYDKLQHLSFAFHDKEHTGNLMSKSTIDVEMMRMFVSMGLIRSGQITMLTIGATTMMMLTDVRLALITLVFVPLIGIRAVWASTRMRRMWLLAQVETGKLTTILQENLAGQRVVKAFGAETHEERKFDGQNLVVYDRTFEARRAQSVNSAIMQVIFWASFGVILWFGGRSVIEGSMTHGQLAGFLLYISLLVQPIRMVGFLVNTFARASSAGERLFDVLDAESPRTGETRCRGAPRCSRACAFRGCLLLLRLTGSRPRHLSRGQARGGRRVDGRARLRQDYADEPALPFLRCRRRAYHYRRRRRSGRHPALAAVVHRHGAAGRVSLQRNRRGEHLLRTRKRLDG